LAENLDDPDDWKQAWRPVVDAIGQDVGDGGVRTGAGLIEAEDIRRYLEPLEFDCALHYDAAVARVHGFRNLVAPYTAILSFAAPPMWQPGERLFTSPERNAQPESAALTPTFPSFFPPFSGYFATDMDVDFSRPAQVGERLSRRGLKLVACDIKETRVGRGAFLKLETEVVNEDGEVLARVRAGIYLYQPHEPIACYGSMR
jgi:hypothetical protein